MYLPTDDKFVKHVLRRSIDDLMKDYTPEFNEIFEGHVKPHLVRALILTFAKMESSFGRYMTTDHLVQSYMDKYNDEWLSKPHGYFHIMGINIKNLVGLGTQEEFESEYDHVDSQIELLFHFISDQIIKTETWKINDNLTGLQRLRAMYYGGAGAVLTYVKTGEFPKTAKWDIGKNVDRFVQVMGQMAEKTSNDEVYDAPRDYCISHDDILNLASIAKDLMKASKLLEESIQDLLGIVGDSVL